MTNIQYLYRFLHRAFRRSGVKQPNCYFLWQQTLLLERAIFGPDGYRVLTGRAHDTTILAFERFMKGYNY